MAKMLTDASVKMGVFLPVENQRPHRLAAGKYLALKVEAEDGGSERWLLFTEKEAIALRPVGGGSWRDSLKAGRLYPISIFGKTGYLLVAKLGELVNTLFITEAMIQRALDRAARNPEDVPKMSRLADMMD